MKILLSLKIPKGWFKTTWITSWRQPHIICGERKPGNPENLIEKIRKYRVDRVSETVTLKKNDYYEQVKNGHI